MSDKNVLLYLPYLPSIAWFSIVLKQDEIWIEQEENFVKATHRNRCEIAGANGKQALSIPIIGGRDHHQLYKEVKIAYQKDWQHIHWQSIRSAYGSAPYFEHYADKFLPFYEKRYELLFEFNEEILNALFRLLRIDKKIQFTFSYEKELTGRNDLRRVAHEKSDTIPLRDGIAIKQHRYYQVFEERNGFIPNLSIIDLLMNEGPGATKYIENY